MKVLVAGGLVFQDRDWLFAGLDLLHAKTPISVIVEGGRPGTDVRAQEWAHHREVRCLTIPARFSQLNGEAEAHQRAELVSAANLVLACPGGDEVVTIAKMSSVPVIFLDKMPVAKRL